jgi:hypothetical protein
MQTQTNMTNVAVAQLLGADLQFNDFPTGVPNFSLVTETNE